MVGANQYRLEESLCALARTLRTDPYALEAAVVSVIAFAGKARTLMPLTDIMEFQPPELPIGGGTAIGRALTHLMDEIDRTVVTATSTRKGDWRPIVFLLTDGRPTDDPTRAVERWNKSYRGKATLVVVSIGGNADHGLLQQLTDDIVVFDDSAEDSFARFVQWVSLSIQTLSRSVRTDGSGKVSLAKMDDATLRPIDDFDDHNPFGSVDDRYAVFVGKCTVSSLPYLVKYEQHQGQIETADPVLAELLETRRYILDKAIPLKQSYFAMSDDRSSVQSVNSDDLVGQPPCPQCHSRFSMALCRCGGIHCVDGDGVYTCPWCGNIGDYGSGGGGGGFDIGRGRG